MTAPRYSHRLQLHHCRIFAGSNTSHAPSSPAPCPTRPRRDAESRAGATDTEYLMHRYVIPVCGYVAVVMTMGEPALARERSHQHRHHWTLKHSHHHSLRSHATTYHARHWRV